MTKKENVEKSGGKRGRRRGNMNKKWKDMVAHIFRQIKISRFSFSFSFFFFIIFKNPNSITDSLGLEIPISLSLSLSLALSVCEEALNQWTAIPPSICYQTHRFVASFPSLSLSPNRFFFFFRSCSVNSKFFDSFSMSFNLIELMKISNLLL